MSDLELLKRYLQNEIDTGGHKIFVFDKDYNAIEFKTIEALNEINNLENQLQQKDNIIKEVREKIKEDNLYLEEAKKMYVEDTDDEMLKIHALQLINNDLSHIDSYLKILDKENK